MSGFSREAAREGVAALMLFAAFMVCLNHLTATMFIGLPLPAWIATEPTIWGVSLLAFGCGMLLHLDLSGDGDRPDLVGIGVGRFFRLAIPIWIAIFWDVVLVGGGEPNPSYTTGWPLISAMLLSHTWLYNVFGNVSLALPFGHSNLIWLGSVLFPLIVFYLLAHSRICALSARGAWLGLSVSVLFSAAYYVPLLHFAPEITSWAADRYGVNLVPVYQFWNWLALYNPLAEATPFFAGAFTGRLFAVRGYRLLPKENLLLVAGGLALLLLRPIGVFGWVTPYTGLNLILVIGAAWVWRKVGRGVAASKLSKLTPLAYEIFVMHILFYALFEHRVIEGEPWWSLLARFAAANTAMVVSLIFMQRFVLKPSYRLIERALRVPRIAPHI